MGREEEMVYCLIRFRYVCIIKATELAELDDRAIPKGKSIKYDEVTISRWTPFWLLIDYVLNSSLHLRLDLERYIKKVTNTGDLVT